MTTQQNNTHSVIVVSQRRLAYTLIILGLLLGVGGFLLAFSIPGAVLMFIGLASLVAGLTYRFVPGASARTAALVVAAIAVLLSIPYWSRIPDLF